MCLGNYYLKIANKNNELQKKPNYYLQIIQHQNLLFYINLCNH